VTLHGGIQRKDKNQQTEITAQDIPVRYKIKILHCESGQALGQVTGETGHSPSLEILRTPLDTALSNLI